MNKEVKNMEVIYRAREKHDVECPFGGIAVRVYMSPFDIDRMGWEEGDNIAGMMLLADESLTTGRFRVECDAEQDQNLIEEESEDLVTA